MADILDKDVKNNSLKDTLKELKEDTEKSRKQYVNKLEISVKRQKT